MSALLASVACSGAMYSGCAHEVACSGQAGASLLLLAGQASQAEVEDLDLAPRRQNQVVRFDIAVDHPLLVGMLQSQGRLPDIVAGVRQRQRSLLLQDVEQTGTLDKLHHQQTQLSGLLRIQSTHDVRMDQAGSGPDLAVEAFQSFGVVQQRLVDDLEGDCHLHETMFGLVDDSHAAASQFLDDAELGMLRQFGG